MSIGRGSLRTAIDTGARIDEINQPTSEVRYALKSLRTVNAASA